MENPFDKIKQEDKYLAWEHAQNSQDLEDNPYKDLPEMSELSSIWTKSFNSNKKRTKRIKPSPLSDLEKQPLDVEVNQLPEQLAQVAASKPTSSNVNLKDISTEVLLAEVLNRVREVDKVMEQMRRIFR